MPKNGQRKQIERWLLRNVDAEPVDLAKVAQKRFGVTRSHINAILRDLVERGELEASGNTRGRVYERAFDPITFDLFLEDGLEEHVVWRDIVLPQLGSIGDRARALCNTGFSEMFNNAIDHSDGSHVRIAIHQSSVAIGIVVVDNGVGIFNKIRDALNLTTEAEAAFELSKGKFTTDPERHSGEGIFFTSRMFDQFAILSGKLAFTHHRKAGDWLLESADDPVEGTAVHMEVNPRTRRRLSAVYDAFSSGPDDYAFDVTHVPVGVLQFGEETLVSRSQARRVLARIPGFKRVFLSFRGVDTIGQAFADEMFRVFPAEHPDIQLSASHTTKQVERMIRRALSAAVAETA